MEVLLKFAGIPLAAVLIVYGLVYAGTARHGKRYRPGRPFEFRPVWFLSAPERVGEASPEERKALSDADTPVALPAAGQRGTDEEREGEWPAVEPALRGVTGGASDTW